MEMQLTLDFETRKCYVVQVKGWTLVCREHTEIPDTLEIMFKKQITDYSVYPHPWEWTSNIIVSYLIKDFILHETYDLEEAIGQATLLAL
jgi:hypothetical protein